MFRRQWKKIFQSLLRSVDLQNYTQDDRASVKHILIETTDPAADPAATPDPTAVDDATGLATAQNVAQQAKIGRRL